MVLRVCDLNTLEYLSHLIISRAPKNKFNNAFYCLIK